MNVAAKLIVALAVIYAGADCNATLRSVEDVTSTSATLVVKELPDCDSEHYVRFQYADSKAALEAGRAQTTPELYFGKHASGCVNDPGTFDSYLTGLSPDTTYYYWQCRRSQDVASARCTSIRQFTTRESAGPMYPVIARNGDLYRNGKKFRVLGVQALDHAYDRKFFATDSDETRADMADRLKAARTMGFNLMRLHLQLFDFIGRDASGVLVANQTALNNLAFLQTVAESEGLYLLVSGNNVWMPGGAPAWYDAMSYEERWEVQSFFFERVAAIGAKSPTILAYELMSEPNIREEDDGRWYFGEFGGHVFVQSIANGVPLEEMGQVARRWIERLRAAIREQDPDRAVTFGALGRFYVGPLGIDNTAPLLDILSPHVYPDAEATSCAMTAARLFAAAGKPVVIGETHLFSSNEQMYRDFIIESAPIVDGYITFFNGVSPEDIVIDSKDPSDVVFLLHKVNLQVMQELREVILEQ